MPAYPGCVVCNTELDTRQPMAIRCTNDPARDREKERATTNDQSENPIPQNDRLVVKGLTNSVMLGFKSRRSPRRAIRVHVPMDMEWPGEVLSATRVEEPGRWDPAEILMHVEMPSLSIPDPGDRVLIIHSDPLEGLRRDWLRVGAYLKNAIDREAAEQDG